jgi:hypothetical protein
MFDKIIADAMGATMQDVCTYAPANGTPAFPVKGMPSSQDRLTDFRETTVQSSGGVFEFLVSALPNPQRDDRVTFRGQTYIVKSRRYLDEERLIWVLDCAP